MTSLYTRLKERVRDYESLVWQRAFSLCREAGLDPTLLGIHPHNAMVSFDQGRPWSGVNYKKVRRVLWLTKRVFKFDNSGVQIWTPD